MTLEELKADEDRDQAMEAAYLHGDADLCDRCGITFYLDDLTEVPGVGECCEDCVLALDGEPERDEEEDPADDLEAVQAFDEVMTRADLLNRHAEKGVTR